MSQAYNPNNIILIIMETGEQAQIFSKPIYDGVERQIGTYHAYPWGYVEHIDGKRRTEVYYDQQGMPQTKREQDLHTGTVNYFDMTLGGEWILRFA